MNKLVLIIVCSAFAVSCSSVNSAEDLFTLTEHNGTYIDTVITVSEGVIIKRGVSARMADENGQNLSSGAPAMIVGSPHHTDKYTDAKYSIALSKKDGRCAISFENDVHLLAKFSQNCVGSDNWVGTYSYAAKSGDPSNNTFIDKIAVGSNYKVDSSTVAILKQHGHSAEGSYKLWVTDEKGRQRQLSGTFSSNHVKIDGK